MKHIGKTLLGLYASLLLAISLVVSLIWELLDPRLGNWIPWLIIFCLVVSWILNIVCAVASVKDASLLYREKDSAYLRKYMKALKMGAIPYFVLNFILYFLLFMLSVAASRGLVILTPIPFMFVILVFFTYLSLLFTAPYGMAYAVIIQREGKMSTGRLVIHILLQLCFVLDVVDTIVLLMKYERKQVDR